VRSKLKKWKEVAAFLFPESMMISLGSPLWFLLLVSSEGWIELDGLAWAHACCYGS
jgi:hypothetical protein